MDSDIQHTLFNKSITHFGARKPTDVEIGDGLTDPTHFFFLEVIRIFEIYKCSFFKRIEPTYRL